MKNNNIHILFSNPIQYNLQDNWNKIQKITAIDGITDDRFGYSVSIDGDTALIGAYGDDEYKGSAYIYTLFENSWTQQVKLSAKDGNQFDYFGLSVSIDGDIALIGAVGDNEHKGSAYIFTRIENSWTQQTKLTVTNGTEGDSFGYSVFLDGDIALIGAYGDDEYKGSAYIFTRIENTWTQQARLTATDGMKGDSFGYSVSIDGNTALIGAVGDDYHKGSAYIFTCTEDTWTQQAKLTATDGTAYDRFGYSVSIDGDSVIIGAESDDEHKGSVYVFTRIQDTWTQQTRLTDLEGVAFDYFSNSVSIDCDTILIAAFGDDEYKGSAYVFTRIENLWIQQAKLTATDGTAYDRFGYSVSIDGDIALIGAFGDDEYKGCAYAFIKNNPPEKPTCSYDKKNDELRVCSTDIDRDLIRYGISWNYNQSVDQWTEFYDSGEEVNVSCERNKGTIGVIVEDEYGSFSDWVPIKSKNKTKNIPLCLPKLFHRFLFFEKILN